MSITLKYSVLILLLIVNTHVLGRPMLSIQSWTTGNGIQVFFNEVHELPIIDIAVIFPAGSAYDGKNFGIASFTNSMLREGTKTLTSDQIAAQFDQTGAQFDFNTDIDTAIVSLKCLTEEEILYKSLETFASVLNEPIFPEYEFKRIQKQMLVSIEKKQQQLSSIALDEFYKTLYGDLPYAHPKIGTQETISSITPDSLREFYNKHYISNNAIVVMVGDVAREQAENIIAKITSKLNRGVAINPLPKILSPPKVTTSHINFSATQTDVVIGNIIDITYNDADYFPLFVGNYILGQAPLVSKLSLELREKRGLVYSIKSGFNPLQNACPFMISFKSSTKNTKEAIDTSMEILKGFVETGPTKEQLNEAKNTLIARFPLSFANNASLLDKLKIIGLHNLPLVNNLVIVTVGESI